jgi:hypothetical protein
MWPARSIDHAELMSELTRIVNGEKEYQIDVQSVPVGFGGRGPLAVACTATAYLNHEQVKGAEITTGTEDAAVKRMKAVLDKLWTGISSC